MEKESRQLRIGVLGCGQICQSAHFEACRKSRNAELYAICDVADDLRQKMVSIHEPTVDYDDYEKMLADEQVEAVLIGVADQFHVPLAQRAIEAGKHVLVEKPLGVTIEECEALQESTRKQNRVLMVGNNRRFDPGLTFAQEFIRDVVGPPMALKAWYYDSTARYTMTDNLQPLTWSSAAARKPSGDRKADRQRYYMLGHGSHLLDTARYLGGEITGLSARFVHRDDSYCWYIAIDYSHGGIGHLDLIIPIRGDMEEGFQVFGAGGSVTGRYPLTWYHKTAHVECFSEKDRVYRRPLGEDGYSYKRQVEGFADTILHGKPHCGARIEDGLATMRGMISVARAVDTGEYVKLSDVKGSV